jgi:hypothetical protein
MATDECIVIEWMYVCYKIRNKQKEWHPATKPLIFNRGQLLSSMFER